MKKWKRLSFLFGMGAAVLLLGAAVLAYWKQTGSTMNILTMGAFQNRIVEKYQVPKEVNPGDSIDKIVNVENTGNVDSLIRVAVHKVFGNTSDTGVFHADPALDPEMIEIRYADTWWEKGKDGYFYYKEVLKPGKTTKEPLFKSYRLSKKTGNEYKGKDARIIVTLESVQADQSMEEIWNVSWKDLGIVLEEGKNGPDTTVVYQGKNGGFAVSESTTDLFASFKLLLPGCTRTQNIVLENRSEDRVELLLRAEVPEQTALSANQKERIRKILTQDAQIQIKEGATILYTGPLSGAGAGKNMQQDISLGYFSAREKKNLTVSLQMDPQMEADAAHLSAKVRWIFSAKGEDRTTITSQTVPTTGDTTAVLKWIGLLTVSMVLFVAALVSRRKERDA